MPTHVPTEMPTGNNIESREKMLGALPGSLSGDSDERITAPDKVTAGGVNKDVRRVSRWAKRCNVAGSHQIR
jgi:hypothetical protein